MNSKNIPSANILAVQPDIKWYNTSQNTFTLTTAEQLAGLSELVNNGTDDFTGKTITLNCNIAINDKTYPTAWTWTPIGNDAHPFNGTFDGIFDGNNYTISGLYLTSFAIGTNSYFNCGGIFGVIGKTGVVKNLLVTDVTLKGKFDSFGAIAGKNLGKITECQSTINIHEETRQCDNTGGLVGTNNGEITLCYTTTNISDTEEGTHNTVGGLVGVNNGDIHKSYSKNHINGNDYIGGLVGENNGTIANCHTTGKIQGANYIGGISGRNNKTIENCYTDMFIDGNCYIGGISGSNETGATIKKCYASRSAAGYPQKKGNITGYNIGTITPKRCRNNKVYKWDFLKIWTLDKYDRPRLRDLPMP